MATERVKVYEEGKKSGIPIWAWLLPLLLLLALLAYFLLHHRTDNAATPEPAPATATAAATPTSTPSTMPDLGSVHFDTDKATITPDGQAILTRGAAYMKANPNTHIRVEGYTDSTGTDPHNDTLANQRAASVKQFLVAQGVDPSRITGEGFGPEKPVASNGTDAGKADNRRVEIFQQQ